MKENYQIVIVLFQTFVAFKVQGDILNQCMKYSMLRSWHLLDCFSFFQEISQVWISKSFCLFLFYIFRHLLHCTGCLVAQYRLESYQASQKIGKQLNFEIMCFSILFWRNWSYTIFSLSLFIGINYIKLCMCCLVASTATSKEFLMFRISTAQ